MRGHTPLSIDTGPSRPAYRIHDFTVAGTYGRPQCIAPEILDPPDDISGEDMDKIHRTQKLNVYSFGITILEGMTRKLPCSHRGYDTVVMLDVSSTRYLTQ